MNKLLKQNYLLIAILVLAAIFYTFRLHQTFVMATDTARDLVRDIEIWQNKEITVIGPPVNTINNKPLEVYFGSMHYYFGLIGMVFSNLDPVGSVYINIVITLVSIPFFFLLSKSLLKSKKLALTATFVYALSPVTLAFTRSYWNPNLIIPLSVFVWFLLLIIKSIWSFILAGTLSGIILNLHYVGIAPVAFYVFLLLFKNERKYIPFFLTGFFLAMSPLIAFELKNNFFLVKAFLSNSGGFSTFSGRTINPFLAFETFFYTFGLGPNDFYLLGQIDLPFSVRIVMDTLVGIPFVLYLIRNQKYLNKQVIAVILFGLLSAWYFETWHIVHMRYAFSVFPLLVISFVAFLSSINKWLVVLVLMPMLLLSYRMINYKLDPTKDYYPVSTVETISKAIVADRPSGKYNVTEDILGDARSLAFRYYLLRDASIKPQPVINYADITILYVISPSKDKIYSDDRWEFDASGPKKNVWIKDFGDLKLFKFIR